jgi:hypothetical protein
VIPVSTTLIKVHDELYGAFTDYLLHNWVGSTAHDGLDFFDTLYRVQKHTYLEDYVSRKCLFELVRGFCEMPRSRIAERSY